VELPACPGIFGSRVLWAEAIDGTARELLREAEADDEGEGTNPRQFLADLLANGPIQAAQVIRDAEAHGYSKRQMQRARQRLGVETDKDGMRGGWRRALPEDARRGGNGTEDTDSACTASSARSHDTFGAEDTLPDPKLPEGAGDKKAAPSAPSAFAWRVTGTNGDSFEMRVVPPATLDQMIERYPGTTVEPLPS